MTTSSIPAVPGSTLSRRSVLKTVAAGAVLAGLSTRSFGQGKELSIWTSQSAPEQKRAFAAAADSFVEANPGYKVVIQTMAEEEILPKLATALAAKTPPSVISNIPPEFVVQLDQQGLVEPMDDVLAEIGEGDFLPNLVDLLRNPETNKLAGLPFIVSTTSGALWYRKDLVAASNVTLPTDWTTMVEAAKQLTKDGVFGTVYPCGKNNMAEKLFLQTVWQSGGFIVDPDLNVSFENEPVIQALEFAKEVLAYSPPNSNSYGYYETVNGFVQGRLAMAPYAGRVLSNVETQNPSLSGKISVMGYPRPKNGVEIYTGDYDSVFVPIGVADVDGAKKLARHLFDKKAYIGILHAVPGHLLPALKSVAESPEMADNPLLRKYETELGTLTHLSTKIRSLLKESPNHKLNIKAGQIVGSHVLIETLQQVVIGHQDPAAAAAGARDKLAAVMKS